MSDVIKFFDVETADKYHTKICQMGIIETDSDGNVINTKVSLINPECEFGDVNIGHHGITSDMVKKSPTLPDVWDYFNVCDNSQLVGHNATFDLAALMKALDSYDIRMPRIEYADTMMMAKHSSYDFPNNSLDTVCEYFGIPLEKHHDALCDAHACMEVYWRLFEGTHSFKEYVYAGGHMRGGSSRARSSELSTYEQFLDLLEHVIEDGVVTNREARTLIGHIRSDEMLMSRYDAGKTLKILELCYKDKHIDPTESDYLVRFMQECLDCSIRQQ